MTNVILILIVCVLLGIVCFVYSNYIRSITNRELIDENKKIIQQNQTLISLINAMISSSDIKVDWQKYEKIAASYGVNAKDPYRDLDINDPEG